MKRARGMRARQKAGYRGFVFSLNARHDLSRAVKKRPHTKTMGGNTSNPNNDCLWVVGPWAVIFLPYFDFSAFFRLSEVNVIVALMVKP